MKSSGVFRHWGGPTAHWRGVLGYPKIHFPWDSLGSWCCLLSSSANAVHCSALDSVTVIGSTEEHNSLDTQCCRDVQRLQDRHHSFQIHDMLLYPSSKCIYLLGQAGELFPPREPAMGLLLQQCLLAALCCSMWEHQQPQLLWKVKKND